MCQTACPKMQVVKYSHMVLTVLVFLLQVVISTPLVIVPKYVTRDDFPHCCGFFPTRNHQKTLLFLMYLYLFSN